MVHYPPCNAYTTISSVLGQLLVSSNPFFLNYLHHPKSGALLHVVLIITWNILKIGVLTRSHEGSK